MNSIQGASAEAGQVQPGQGVAPEAQMAVGVQPEMPGGGQAVNDNMTITPNSISADYGKMIDEALAEPLPGEAGAEQAPASTPEEPAGGSVNPAGASVVSGGTEMPGAGAANGNEFPPIIPTGGTLGYQSPATMTGDIQGGMQSNPEMQVINGEPMPMGMQAPEMGQANPVAMPTQEADMGMNINPGGMPAQGLGAEANPAAMQAPVLPMPGQELAPPPMAPMPDFGTLPPVQEVPSANPEVPAAEAAPANPIQSPAVVQPEPGTNTSAPLGSFQIPGM